MGKLRQSKSINMSGLQKVAKVPYGRWVGDCREGAAEKLQWKAVEGVFQKKP